MPNTSGASFLYDQSADQVTLTAPTDVVALELFTISGGAPTAPQLKVGRDGNQYWGVYTDDRNAVLIHRQDESSGTMYTRFQQWDSNTSDDTGAWVWQLDISGNIDIDGTTNLDAVDIDGAVQIDNTLTVGADDTGHDVKFFGATANHYMLWDESKDLLQVAGDLEIKNANGSNPADAGSLVFNESGATWASDMYGFRVTLEGSANELKIQSASTSTVKEILKFALNSV